jgi:hypothetical protein
MIQDLSTMKTYSSLKALLCAGLVSALALPAFAADQTSEDWKWDASLYGLAAGMSGDVTLKGLTADVDIGFDKILDNLQFAAMGSLRVSQGRWGGTVDVIYMGLGAAKDGARIDFDQWLVEPTVSYRLSGSFEVLGGVRYNYLNADIRVGEGLPTVRTASGTMDWFDPIVGFNYDVPISSSWSFHLRADVGGISGLTWQAYPAFNWHFSETGLMQVGYRWVDYNYSTGSGTSQFRFNILDQGLQLGVTFRL